MIAFAPPTHAALHSAVTTSHHGAPHGWQRHVVRPGDTLFDLALRYRTTVPALVEHNHLHGGGHLIIAGSTLLVPRTSAARPSASVNRRAPQAVRHAPHRAARVKAKRPARSMTTVRVRSGDTISGLALAHHASSAAIMKANGITDARALQIGQSLRIPSSAASTPAPGAAPRRTSHASTPQFRSTSFSGRSYSSTVVGSAAANKRLLAGRPVPNRSATQAMIRRTASRHGLDPRLALAIAYQESGWNQRQVSVANAIGTMQIIPSSGQWASQLVGHRLDLLDTQDNITAGVVILRTLTQSAANEGEAIAGYYQGLAGVRRNGMYADTRQYVANIRFHKSRM